MSKFDDYMDDSFEGVITVTRGTAQLLGNVVIYTVALLLVIPLFPFWCICTWRKK